MPIPNTRSRGFTLVELSIVLAVIGLLVGGVLVGRDMIRNTEVKNFAKDQENIHSAFQQFYDRYNALPGDMPNATSIWGAQNATAATCQTTASTSALTCNGNGSGRIAAAAESASYEKFRAWQHLANAKLIEGRFNGTSDRPMTKFAGMYFEVSYLGALSADGIWFDGDYNHALYVTNAVAPLKAREMADVDAKFDDGLPAQGDYVGNYVDGTYHCALKADSSPNPASSDVDAIYNRESASAICMFARRNFVGR